MQLAWSNPEQVVGCEFLGLWVQELSETFRFKAECLLPFRLRRVNSSFSRLRLPQR